MNGVLRALLFDIDPKLRFALQQGTVGAMIGGTFLVASEVLERLFPVDGMALGLVPGGPPKKGSSRTEPSKMLPAKRYRFLS